MFTTPLLFIDNYMEWLNEAIMAHSNGQGLSRIQRAWLKFCLMGILLTNTVCWAAFERAGLGEYQLGAVSWMFRHSRIAWNGLWLASVSLVLSRYGISEGVLVADDTDHQRAKRTKQIWKAAPTGRDYRGLSGRRNDVQPPRPVGPG